MAKNLYIIAGCNGAGKTTASLLKAQTVGYHVTLLFFWLQTVELAKKRVTETLKSTL